MAQLLTVLVRGLVGLFQVSTPATPMGTGFAEYEDLVCEDGLPIYDPKYDKYVVRKDCTFDGCAFRDEICYFGDYFERCLDVNGRATGRCETETQYCNGRLACLVLYINCDGAYGCRSSTWLGCEDGICTEPIP